MIAESNSSGANTAKFAFSPFGETSTVSASNFGYTGQRYDSEIGLYNYKARYYAPSIGRFMQPDPIGYSTGDLNIYSYVANDPMNLTDPLGLQSLDGCECTGGLGKQLLKGFVQSLAPSAADTPKEAEPPKPSIIPPGLIQNLLPTPLNPVNDYINSLPNSTPITPSPSQVPVGTTPITLPPVEAPGEQPDFPMKDHGWAGQQGAGGPGSVNPPQSTPNPANPSGPPLISN